MAKALVVVESPAKAKTINKYLGKDYKVIASMGHVRDLPKSKLGVDVDEGFEPTYEVIASRKKVLKELKAEAKKATEIFIATDPDREGEAIGWHLAEELGSANKKKIRRLMFNEITKKGVLAALDKPTTIDKKMVDAQQARRVLDRLVGYKISPLLWDKVRRGLSAGRVQSVALKLVCDREREISAFVPEEYWNLTARLAGPVPPEFDAKLLKKDGANIKVGNEAESERRSCADLKSGALGRRLGHDQGAQEERGSALHHEQAAAGVALPGQEDDDDRAAALRRRGAAGRRARSVSSPTCAPTRRACRSRRSTKCGSSSPARSAPTTCRRSRTSTRRSRTRRTRTRRSARPRCSTTPTRSARS